MAALHPLGLFNHNPDIPTYSNPTLQLQSDPIQSSPNLSVQNFESSSLAAAQRLVSLQEEWPGGDRACLWDPALLPDDGGGGGTYPPHSTWQHCLLKSNYTFNHTHFMDTGHKPIQDTALRRKFYEDRQLLSTRTHTKDHLAENWNQIGRVQPSILNSTSPAPPLPTSHTSRTRGPPPSHPVPPVPPPSSLVNWCNVSAQGPPLLAARVESLYAEDLDYHSKGTSHWPPLNASSQDPGGGGASVTGALTFIAHYFTPQWVM